MNRLIVLVFCLFALGLSLPQPSAHAAPEDDVVALAKKTLNGLQKNSIKGRREYCGYIARNRNKALVATRARGGTQASCMMPPVPSGLVPIATYHTHGAFDLGYDNETPSYQDLRSDIDADLNGFIATPGGRLWFSNKESRSVRIICGARCLITDPSYSETRHGPIEESYSLKDLARR